MTFENFKKLLPKIHKMSIPGAVAQQEMAPAMRQKAMEKLDLAEKNPRHAAVLLLCYPKFGEVYFVLIQRPVYEGVHSGQIALPGGKVETEDASYKHAALRETFEEIGVEVPIIKVIKEMTKTYIPPSNFWVHPFLGYSEELPVFVAQEEEVAAIIEVSLEELLADKNIFTDVLTTSYAKAIEVPAFKLNGYRVWGATAMMLNELKVFLKTVIQA